MPIKYILREDLEEHKYNKCIEKSKQSNLYGYSWYLDIVCESWDVLVLNNYEAVMPIPWKKKYVIKYICQPFFCQQLGVFSTVENKQLTEEFIDSIPAKFLKISLQFNSLNIISEERNISQRLNYILLLNDSYKNIFKSFSKGRKHAVKQAMKNELISVDFSIDELILIAKQNYDFDDFSSKEFTLLKQLIEALKNRNKLELLGIRDANNTLIGGSVFLIDSHRIIYLFSAMSKEGKEKQVPSFLLNQIIEKYSESQRILDFEGSMIPGIASFFKSFGSIVENYSFLQVNRLPFLLRLLKS
jgi:hypothetical protein